VGFSSARSNRLDIKCDPRSHPQLKLLERRLHLTLSRPENFLPREFALSYAQKTAACGLRNHGQYAAIFMEPVIVGACSNDEMSGPVGRISAVKCSNRGKDHDYSSISKSVLGVLLWSTQFDTPDRVSALRPSSTYEILEQCIEFGISAAQTANSTGGNTQFCDMLCGMEKKRPRMAINTTVTVYLLGRE